MVALRLYSLGAWGFVMSSSPEFGRLAASRFEPPPGLTIAGLKINRVLVPPSGITKLSNCAPAGMTVTLWNSIDFNFQLIVSPTFTIRLEG